MSHFEVRIAGMGGQGIIMAAVMIGRAASIFGGKNVTLTQSYGPESRGGACKAEVIVSDERVDYPKVRQPNLVAIMSEEAYQKNITNSNSGATIVIDPDMVQEDQSYKHGRVFRVPATRIAEGLGKRIVANMVMVGAIVALTSIVDVAAVEKAIAKYTPRGTEKLNAEAFRSGHEFARKLLEKRMVTG
jgi:2-oxoglutarate ferredoxin oxidoreductase subunit gamma